MATTTKFWTLAEIRAKIERDLDTEEETFVTQTELHEYINEGIDIAESEIQTLYEDYFLTKANLPLVDGADEIDLPTDIYAHKIRRITWRKGADVYTVSRIRDWKKFEDYEIQRITGSSTTYAYFLLNSTPGSPKVLLTPPANETDSTSMTCWYLRQANRLSDDADVCDIPEFVYFVIQYAKVRIMEKESHPMLQKGMADLVSLKNQMSSTLTAMVPDDDNEIEPDLSHYLMSTGGE